MKEIIQKISSYNLFNYLLPGTIYLGLVNKSTTIDIIDDNLFITGFLCYFTGMIISRIGSLIIEPVLKKLKFIKHKEYHEYIDASLKDEKIAVLSEQNNTYRSLFAMTLLLPLTIIYDRLRLTHEIIHDWDIWFILVGVALLFLFAYRKQTIYITKRIDNNK